MFWQTLSCALKKAQYQVFYGAIENNLCTLIKEIWIEMIFCVFIYIPFHEQITFN